MRPSSPHDYHSPIKTQLAFKYSTVDIPVAPQKVTDSPESEAELSTARDHNTKALDSFQEKEHSS